MVDELKIAQKAIDLGLISKSQLDECLKIQQDLNSLGMESKSLQQILISKKYIAQENWQEINGNAIDFDSDILNNSSHKTVKIEDPDLNIAETEINDNIIEKKRFPVIDGYEISREIGKGAMGSVFQGVQISMERPVAIKVLDKKLSQDNNLVDRFTLEAKTIARLNHDNIIGGIDAGTTKDKLYYFVMEFVEGKALGDVLDDNGKMDIMQAVQILIKVADALEYAHQEGIIHRDIKPDNIILTNEGEPKLCDLGLVRDCATDSRLTMEGHALGTPHYISPEQARGLRDEIDHRSDIYSFGASFYHIVTGSPPFPQKNPAVVCAMHATKPFPHPHTLDPSIPKAICKIIDRCTQKKPNKRYQSCDQIVRDLQSFAENYNPFQQDEDEQKTQVYNKEYDEDYEDDDDSYDFEEEQKPLTFIDEPNTQSRRRRKTRSQPRGQQIVVGKTTSKTATTLIVVFILAMIAGGGFAFYSLFLKDVKTNTKIGEIPVVENDLFAKIKQTIQFELPKIKLINLDNSEAVTQALGVFLRLKDRYENEENEELKARTLSFIRSQDENFKKTLKSEAKKRADIILPEVEDSMVDWKKGSPNSLRVAHRTLSSFPRGLLGYTDEIGQNIKDKKDSIEQTIGKLQEKDKEKAEQFREEKDYPNVKKIYQKILGYTLDEEGIKEELRDIEEEYLTFQERVWKKEGDLFRRGIDIPLIKGSKNFNSAKEHVISYQNKKGFEQFAQDELTKLNYYIDIVGQLRKSDSTLKKLDKERPANLLDEMSIPVNDSGLWALGVASIEFEKWRKAFGILEKQKNTEIFKKYLDKKLQEDNVASLYKKLQGYQKNIKGSFEKIQTLGKYRNTSFYKEQKDNFKQLQDKIEEAYLEEYALELFFQGKLQRKNKLDFSIQYSLQNLSELKDFWGKKDETKINDLKLAYGGNGVFEIYWKGKVRNNLKVWVSVTSNVETAHNMGISFFKRKEDLNILDKYLFLLNYSTLNLVANEIDAKEKNARYYKAKVEKIPQEKENSVVLAYLRDKAASLRRSKRYKSIVLKGVKAPKAIKFNDIAASVFVQNKRIYVKAGDTKFSSLLKESPIGYVGLYSNFPASFSKLKIRGTFDKSWAEQTKKEVLRDARKYLEIAKNRLKK